MGTNNEISGGPFAETRCLLQVVELSIMSTSDNVTLKVVKLHVPGD